MKRFVVGMLIIGSVIAVIALIVRRRSGSGAEEWDTFAEDTWARASTPVSTVTDTAEEGASSASDSAKDATSKVSETAKDAASKVPDAATQA